MLLHYSHYVRMMSDENYNLCDLCMSWFSMVWFLFFKLFLLIQIIIALSSQHLNSQNSYLTSHNNQATWNEVKECIINTQTTPLA